MTLRRRILLGLMVLVGIGLVVTDGALWFGLHRYLYDQVDAQLVSLAGSRQASQACGGDSAPFSGNVGSPAPSLPATSYVAFVASGGRVLCSGFLDSQASSYASPPVVPTSFGNASGEAPIGTPFDRTSVSGSTGYRLLVLSATFDRIEPGDVVVAIPTDGVAATLSRLLLIEVVTTLVILLAVAAAAWSMIKVGLRPLDDMTGTAGAIAAGDLSRRVPPSNPRTEVGRLGTALNTMLAQIESAFAARERSESRLRRFVADASHELRTPLTSIRGYAELFRRGAARRPEDLATAMRRIEEEATRMSVLVDDLLQLARLDIAAAENREPVRDTVDLAVVARDAVGDLRAVEPDRKVRLEAERATVMGDEGALRQVLANLLANARHHTPPEAVVTVRTGAALDGSVAFLEVADDGPGMSKEDAAHAFERFWRADPARARGHGGAGLGLSIVAAIADAHGGTVRLDTAPGAGCRLRLELPGAVTTIPAPMSSQPAPAATPEAAPGAPEPAPAPAPPRPNGVPVRDVEGSSTAVS